VALLGGGSYLVKNGAGFLRPKSKGARKLNVAETRMLGNRQFLVVAEYEGRRMLLGVCPGRIELLSELGSQTEDTFGVRLNESR
jgi:flagellar protein FliO/FliZ